MLEIFRERPVTTPPPSENKCPVPSILCLIFDLSLSVVLFVFRYLLLIFITPHKMYTPPSIEHRHVVVAAN